MCVRFGCAFSPIVRVEHGISTDTYHPSESMYGIVGANAMFYAADNKRYNVGKVLHKIVHT